MDLSTLEAMLNGLPTADQEQRQELAADLMNNYLNEQESRERRSGKYYDRKAGHKKMIAYLNNASLPESIKKTIASVQYAN